MINQFDIYGQKIINVETNEIYSIELLARPKDGVNVNNEDYFSSLEPSVSYNWFKKQVEIAILFCQSTGIECSVNLDRFITPFFIDDKVERCNSCDLRATCKINQYKIEITQIQDIPKMSYLTSVINNHVLCTGVNLDDFSSDDVLCFGQMTSDYGFSGIKFDVSFVEKAVNSEETRKNLSEMCTIAKNRNIDLIIEGIETEEQLNIFKEVGFKLVQGFYFHTPEPIEDLEKQLEKT